MEAHQILDVDGLGADRNEDAFPEGSEDEGTDNAFDREAGIDGAELAGGNAPLNQGLEQGQGLADDIVEIEAANLRVGAGFGDHQLHQIRHAALINAPRHKPQQLLEEGRHGPLVLGNHAASQIDVGSRRGLHNRHQK